MDLIGNENNEKAEKIKHIIKIAIIVAVSLLFIVIAILI